ncbi:MAG: hypothetical protein GY804_01950 [Alphaproteobacteria bacterium]|nr:hypothetical protein [Alphaproteobacteria bacterium]
MIDETSTRPGDEDFHKSRVMFCIVDGEVRVAARGSSMSHSEWFRAEGWMNSDSKAEFMDATIRCFVSEDRGSVYFYKGNGFYFDDVMVKEVLSLIPQITQAIPEITKETLVKFGPADDVVNGVRFSSFCHGKIG